MPVNSPRVQPARIISRSWTRLLRQLTTIGAGILIAALAVTGAQFAATSAKAAGTATPSATSGSISGSISGTVTDVSQAPIVGISVTAYLWDAGSQQWNWSANVTTDSSGLYTFPGLADGDYSIEFTAGSNPPVAYIDQWYPNQPNQGTATSVTVSGGADVIGIDASLVVGNSVAGTVTNSQQAKLENIFVSAELYDTQSATYNTVAWATTDASGNYSFPALASGTYAIRFDSPYDALVKYQTVYYAQGLTAADSTPVVVDGADQIGVNMQLTLSNTISGTVKDTAVGSVTAKALAGITVRAQVQRYNAQFDYSYYDTVTETVTSSTGAYTLGGLPDGTYVVQFSSADGAAKQYLTEYYNNQKTADDALTNTPVLVHGGQVLPLSLANLALSATITGSLTPSVNGAAITTNDAWISACVAEPIYGYLNCNYGRAFIATNGTYTIADLPAGTYSVYVQYNGSENLLSEYYSTTTTTAWSSSDASNIVLAAGAAATGKNVALNEGATITGTVSRDGGGVESTVTAYHDLGYYNELAGNASSDSSGNYTINKLLPGKYIVSADGGSGESAAATQWNGGGYSEHRAPRIALLVGTASHTKANANFALEAAGSLSGAVVDNTGQTGVGNVTVTATRYDSETSVMSNNQDFTATTEPDGMYFLTGLQPGYYTLSFSNDGYLTTQYFNSDAGNDRVVVVSGDATPRLSDVTMHHSGTITGLVTDTSDNPLVGVKVSDGLYPCDYCASTSAITDENGSYTLTGLDPGKANTVYFHTEALDSASSPTTHADSSLALPLGSLSAADSGPIAVDTVVLGLSSIVTGKVTDSALVAQANMTIQAVVKDDQGGNRVLAKTVSASNGTYTLTDVPDGAVLYFSTNALTSAASAKFASQYDGGTTNINLASVLSFGKPGQTLRHDIVLLPIGSITGTIKKGTTVLAGVKVSAYSVNPDNPNQYLGFGQAVTDTSGVYTIPGLAQGSYTVSFNNRASGASLVDASGALIATVSTSVGQATTPAIVPWNAAVTANAVLAPTVKVSGTVTGPASAKLSGVSVFAYPWNGTVAGSATTQGDGFDSVITNSLGNYSLALTPGTYVLKFLDPLGRVSTRYLGGTTVPADTNKVTVVATALTGKNIALVSTAATLTATVVTQNGDAAGGGSYTLDRVATDGKTVLSSLLAPTWNDLSSAFPIHNLEAGKYRLVLNDNSWDPSLTVTFTVVGNAVTTYEIGYDTPVTGTGGDLGQLIITQTDYPAYPAIRDDALPVISVVEGSNGLAVGSMLQSDNSEENWNNSLGNFEYQWLRNGSEIPNAASAQYMVAPGDAGAAISLRITAEGLVSYTTAATETVSPGSLGEGGYPAITATPSASNTVSVGQSVTAAPGSYSVSGLTYSYSWIRGESPIAGATAATYVLKAADVGASLSVSVTAKRAGYLPNTLTSNAMYYTIVAATALSRTTAAAPTKAGSTYTARPGTWSPTGATISYSWLTLTGDITPLPGQDGSTFTPSDSTSAVLLRTTATKTGYAPTTVEDVVRVGSGLLVSGTPALGGSGAVGSPITVGASSNHASATFTYQWFKSATLSAVPAAISGATLSTYEPVPADVGKFISVKVTAKEYGFTASVPVASAVKAITASAVGTMGDSATVTGNYWVGRTLTASTGAWVPTPTSFTYKWMRSNTNGGTYTAIVGATASKYALVAADLGKYLKVVVTPVRTGFTYAAFTSAANQSAAIAQPVTNLAAPSIGAVGNVGTTLTANAGTWDVAAATFGYQWLVNGRTIPGATAVTYTPTPENLFDEISVKVTANKATYPSGDSSSTQSNSVTIVRGIGAVATVVPTFKVDTSTTNATASTVLSWGSLHTLHGTSGTWPTGTRSVDYQWQTLGTDSAAQWTNLVGENTDTLVMAVGNTSVVHGGWKYRLVVTARRTGYQDSTANSVAVRLNAPAT